VPVAPGDHIQGPDDAPVTLVEYGDYECPFCGEAYPIVKQIQKALGPNLRFVFRNFPLTESHPHALHAAQAAEAAVLQNRFWEMHDLLFENQQTLEDGDLITFAQTLGLNMSKWRRDYSSEQVVNKIEADMSGGLRSGVNGTPTFFINGERHDGSFEYSELLAAVQEQLEPQRQSARQRQARPHKAGERRMTHARTKQ
jgi:protein-disulfide isomerase